MRITLLFLCCLGGIPLIAQNTYFLYGLDYVDPNIKYLEIQDDLNSTVYKLYDPVQDSISFTYQIKPEYVELISRFPDSVSLDTNYFNIVDTVFHKKELLYTLFWNVECKCLQIRYLDGNEQFEINNQNELIFKRFVRQKSKFFLGNCNWGDCGFSQRDWDIEYHVKTRFRGKKKVEILGGEKAYMFEFSYRSDLPELSWKSAVYFDAETHMPIAMIIQKMKWKYDKDERYIGIDTKHYVKKEFESE